MTRTGGLPMRFMARICTGEVCVRSTTDPGFGRERSVVTELPARPGQPRRIALAPGGYVVQQRSPRTLRVARIQLARGDDRVLAEHQMQELPLLRLVRKGSPGQRRVCPVLRQFHR